VAGVGSPLTLLPFYLFSENYLFLIFKTIILGLPLFKKMYFRFMNKIQKLIIKKMADGYTQPEVSRYLKEREITPNSISMIEKELKKLKKEYGALNMVHLFVLLSKKGHLT